MSNIRWTNGAGGAWGSAGNWAGSVLPGSGDNVTIDLAGTYTVTLAGAQAAHALLLNDAGAIVADTGTLTLGGALTASAGVFALDAGGVVAGGTLSASGGAFAWNGGTLSGASYQGTLDLTASGASLIIANGFTATGAGGTGQGDINATGGAASLTFAGTQTLDNLRIDAGNAAGGGTSVNFDTLTLGANALINQVGGNATASCWSIDSGTLVVNNGTWQALQFNGGADVVASITNNGLIAAANGGGFTLQGNDIANTGTISATLGSGIGISGYASMTNSGTILDAGGVAVASPNFVNNGLVELSGVNDYFAIVGTYGGPITTITSGTGTIDLSGSNVGLRLEQDQALNGGTVILGGSGNNITISHPYPLNYAATASLGAGATIDITGTSGIIADDGYAGDALISSGTINETVAGASASIALQSFTNNGIVNVAGGDHLAIGNAIAGTGSLTMAAAGTLELTGSVATGQSLAFLDGAADLLKLDTPAAMHGTVTGFASGNTIDLAGINATSAAWNAGTLSLSLSGGGSLALAVAGSYASSNFILHSDGAGGTDVTLAAGTTGGGPTGGGTGVSVLSVSTDGLGPFGVWTTPNFNANSATMGQLGQASASSASSASYGGAAVASNQTVSAGWTSAYAGSATFNDFWSSTSTTSGGYNAEQSFGMQAGPGYANATFSVTMTTDGSFSINWTATEASTGPNSGNGTPFGLFGLLNMVAVIDGGTAMQVNPVNANLATPTGTFSGTLTAGTHTIAIEDWSNYSGAMGTFTGSLSETLSLSITPSGTGTPPPPPPPSRSYGGSGASLTTTEGSAVTAPLATFTDSNTTDAAGTFSATIAWGDGTTSAGVVTGTNGSFTITPATGHAYADEGSYATTVSVLSAADGTTTTLAGSVTAGEADVLAATTPQPISATAGQAWTGTLATFTDSYAGASAADLTATITWGDGSTSTGTISAVAVGFAVTGSHTWSASGSDAVTVTLSDPNGSASATASTTATVAAGSTGDQSWTLTRGVDLVDGGSGHDSIIAREYTLSAGDVIDGGSGLSNSLSLVGGGAFNLTLPTVLENINLITAVEGYGVAVPAITLRAGLDANVKLTSSLLGAQATALVVGAANNATITLGNGSDTVYLGAGEKLVTGSGNNTIHVDATSAGDRITAGSGHNTLVVDGGGNITLGRADTGISTVTLSAATNLRLNGMSFLTATGSTGNDTIAAGGAQQTLTGGLGTDTLIGSTLGADTFSDSAAGMSGDLIRGFLASDQIVITDIAAAGAHIAAVTRGATTQVTLSAGGSSTSFLLQGAFTQAGFSLASDGHAGTVITHS